MSKLDININTFATFLKICFHTIGNTDKYVRVLSRISLITILRIKLESVLLLLQNSYKLFPGFNIPILHQTFGLIEKSLWTIEILLCKFSVQGNSHFLQINYLFHDILDIEYRFNLLFFIMQMLVITAQKQKHGGFIDNSFHSFFIQTLALALFVLLLEHLVDDFSLALVMHAPDIEKLPLNGEVVLHFVRAVQGQASQLFFDFFPGERAFWQHYWFGRELELVVSHHSIWLLPALLASRPNIIYL